MYGLHILNIHEKPVAASGWIAKINILINTRLTKQSPKLSQIMHTSDLHILNVHEKQRVHVIGLLKINRLLIIQFKYVFKLSKAVFNCPVLYASVISY